MATAVAGVLGRGARLGALGAYTLLHVRPKIACDLGVWSGRGTGRRGRWSTSLEKSGGVPKQGRRQEAHTLIEGAGRRASAWLRCSTISGGETRSRQQARCLSTQGSNDAKSPRNNTSTSLQKPVLSTLHRHENIYTLPNLLTTTRLVCAPAIGYLLLHSSYPWALGLFIYAGVTDLVDGWIARRYNSGTVVGTILDPMADKALMTVVVGVLGWQQILPLPLAVLILGRDVLLSLTAFYYRYVSLPPPRTLARYWDFSLPSAEVKPTSISKVNTFLQLGLIGATMTGLAFPSLMSETAQSALEISWWVVGATTVWSGASYLGKGGVRILGKKSS